MVQKFTSRRLPKVLINPYRVKDFHGNVMADSKHMTTMCSVILVIVMSLLKIIN